MRGGAAALDAQDAITFDGHAHFVAGAESELLPKVGGKNKSTAIV
jgi:hypothetical protein